MSVYTPHNLTKNDKNIGIVSVLKYWIQLKILFFKSESHFTVKLLKNKNQKYKQTKSDQRICLSNNVLESQMQCKRYKQLLHLYSDLL